MNVNELKSLMDKLPLVSAILLDLEMFKRIIHTFTPEHVNALDRYYKFLGSEGQMTIFDLQRYQIVISKKYHENELNFFMIQTSLGLVRASKN